MMKPFSLTSASMMAVYTFRPAGWGGEEGGRALQQADEQAGRRYNPPRYNNLHSGPYLCTSPTA